MRVGVGDARPVPSELEPPAELRLGMEPSPAEFTGANGRGALLELWGAEMLGADATSESEGRLAPLLIGRVGVLRFGSAEGSAGAVGAEPEGRVGMLLSDEDEADPGTLGRVGKLESVDDGAVGLPTALAKLGMEVFPCKGGRAAGMAPGLGRVGSGEEPLLEALGAVNPGSRGTGEVTEPAGGKSLGRGAGVAAREDGRGASAVGVPAVA